MASVTVTGTITDSLGVVFNFSAVATQAPTLSATVTITPAVAPAGTQRTLVVTPVGGTAPFTFSNPVASGVTFTPVSGNPGHWTFVY